MPPLVERGENRPEAGLDAVCQIIEGVSHFVYVVERARVQREATELEMELQADVDKWVVLAASVASRGSLDVDRSADLRSPPPTSALSSSEHGREPPPSERGERYRVANDTAHRFVRRLERDYLERARFGEMRAELRRFFRVGQEEKLRLARVA